MISLDTENDVEITENKLKLSTIFDDENVSNEHCKSKLFYKPKQNKIQEKIKLNNQFKLNSFLALPVNVYKYDNGKYSYIGKYGLALLGNNNETLYRIILYTAKNQPICLATITDDFKFVCQPNDYLSFRDDHQQSWSVLFSNHADLCSFIRNVAHCLFAIQFGKNSQNETILDILIIQPLGYFKTIEQITKKFQFNERIIYKLKVSVFEQIGLSHDNSVLLLDDADRCLTINENNIDLIQKFFAGSANQNYIVIPFKDLDKYKWIMPNDFGEKDKLYSTNYKMVSFELELIRNECSMIHSDQLMNNKQNISFDLTNKMSQIRALQILPLNTEQQLSNKFNSDSCTNIKTNVLKNEPSDMLSSYDSLKNIFEAKFNILNKNVEELKVKLENVNNWKTILDSNLTLDSAMLINSIQNIIAENHKLKIELEDKKNEMIYLNQKLFKFVENGSSDSGCSTPNVEILKLKEEIIILKERINELREENYRYKWEKNCNENLIKVDTVNSLKRISSEIRGQFNDVMSMTCEKDKHYLDNLMDFVLRLIAEIDSNSGQALNELPMKK